MPLIKSAIKRARQNETRRARRAPVKSYMKTMVRKFTVALKEGKKDDAQKMLSEVYSSIDMAAKKNLIHRNTAARKKSLMNRMLAAK